MPLLLAWTTTESEADARELARAAVEAGLAACVQIDGPITSVFPWKGRIDTGAEYRLLFKFLHRNLEALEVLIHERHPYETPEWIVVEATRVGEKYLKWASDAATSDPLQP